MVFATFALHILRETFKQLQSCLFFDRQSMCADKMTLFGILYNLNSSCLSTQVGDVLLRDPYYSKQNHHFYINDYSSV